MMPKSPALGDNSFGRRTGRHRVFTANLILKEMPLLFPCYSIQFPC